MKLKVHWIFNTKSRNEKNIYCKFEIIIENLTITAEPYNFSKYSWEFSKIVYQKFKFKSLS